MSEKIVRNTVFKTGRPANAAPRPIKGVVLHHTGGARAVDPHENGSWHYMVDRNGDVYYDIREEDVAWHAANTDRWRPNWLQGHALSWFGGSDINCVTIGIELVSCPGTAVAGYTEEQIASCIELFDELVERHGLGLRFIGHGHIQKDRRVDEPSGFPWPNMIWIEGEGYEYTPSNKASSSVSQTEESEMSIEEKALFDSLAKHELKTPDDIDQLMGRYDLLAQQVDSLNALLATAQQERDAATARAEASEEKCKNCDPAVVGGA